MHKIELGITILFPAACEERNEAWVVLSVIILGIG